MSATTTKMTSERVERTNEWTDGRRVRSNEAGEKDAYTAGETSDNAMVSDSPI